MTGGGPLPCQDNRRLEDCLIIITSPELSSNMGGARDDLTTRVRAQIFVQSISDEGQKAQHQ